VGGAEWQIARHLTAASIQRHFRLIFLYFRFIFCAAAIGTATATASGKCNCATVFAAIMQMATDGHPEK